MVGNKKFLNVYFVSVFIDKFKTGIFFFFFFFKLKDDVQNENFIGINDEKQMDIMAEKVLLNGHMDEIEKVELKDRDKVVKVQSKATDKIDKMADVCDMDKVQGRFMLDSKVDTFSKEIKDLDVIDTVKCAKFFIDVCFISCVLLICM